MKILETSVVLESRPILELLNFNRRVDSKQCVKIYRDKRNIRSNHFYNQCVEDIHRKKKSGTIVKVSGMRRKSRVSRQNESESGRERNYENICSSSLFKVVVFT